MLALFLLLATAKISVASYTMPALCTELSKATGETYSVNIALKDYPVFVSVKSGDPERVKTLVAEAFHAQWLKEGKTYTLAPKPLEKDGDYVDFESLLKVALAKDSVLATVPPKDLYDMAPGDIIRYGDITTPVVKPWPTKDSSPDGQPRQLIIHRFAPGVFECRYGQASPTFELDGLNQEVIKLLEKKLDLVVIDAKQKNNISKLSEDFQSFKFDFSDLSKKDPIAALVDMVLPLVAEAIDQDMVAVLPDQILFPVSSVARIKGTVKSVLGLFSMTLNWGVCDGALVGKLTNCELKSPTQAKRDVLARFIKGIGAKGVGNVGVLGEYVRSQRPSSSDCWIDVMLLAFAGVVIDDEYIGDYPYNIRLFTALSKSDWNLLNQKEPFPMSSLASSAQQQAINLLMKSRSRLGGGRIERGINADPGWWPSRNPRDLVVTAEIIEEPVLICRSTMTTDVMTYRNAAINHRHRIGAKGQEPTYQQANRRKLKLTISPANQAGNSPDAPLEVETGFSEVTILDLNAKPVPYTKLPADIKKIFDEAIKSQSQDGGPPTQIDPL